MRTTHTLATSAGAMLGLVFFGAVNLAQAGNMNGSGKEMGHGPVVNTSGRDGKEMGHGPVVDPRGKDGKYDKDWYKDWNRYGYLYGYPSYGYATEAYATPVVSETPCESHVCSVPVYETPYSYYQPFYGYENYRSWEYYRSYYNRYYSGHREHPLDNSKPTTASSHRTGENLGSTAHHMSAGKGRR